MQTITSQFVACLFFSSCSPQFCMPSSHLLCKKYNLPTRQGFGPAVDVTTTLWCTEYWSNVVVSGVYRSTSARSTSPKLSIESNIQRYGAPCGFTESSQHTWDYYNGFTANKKGQFRQTKKVMHFQSNEERNRATHCPPYCSTRCCNILSKTIWNGGKKNKKGSDWATKPRTAWRSWDLLTTSYSSPRRWKGYVKCYVSSRPAQKWWVWESTQTRRRYSVTRTK